MFLSVQTVNLSAVEHAVQTTNNVTIMPVLQNVEMVLSHVEINAVVILKYVQTASAILLVQMVNLPAMVPAAVPVKYAVMENALLAQTMLKFVVIIVVLPMQSA